MAKTFSVISLAFVLLLSLSIFKGQISSEVQENNLTPSTLQLVYSQDRKVYTYNLRTGDSQLIGIWEGIYDYEISFPSLQRFGGEVKVVEPHDPAKPYAQLYHQEIKNPFQKDVALESFYEDQSYTSWLLLKKNGVVYEQISNDDLGIELVAMPIGWLSEYAILLADAVPGVGKCEEYFILNLQTKHLEPLNIAPLLDYSTTILLDETLTEVIGLNETQGVVIVDLQNSGTLSLPDIQATYLWGWVYEDDLPQLQSEIAEFNNQKRNITLPPPFLYWPVPSNHTVACGIECYSGHHGIDIGVNTNSTEPIFAAASGTVVTIDNSQPYGFYRETSPIFGNFVRIVHDNGYYTNYYHLSSDVRVSPGQYIPAGTLIGFGSNSGNTCGTQPAQYGCMGYSGSYYHLHFEVWRECGTSACWANPYVENLWILNDDGTIADPPVPCCGCALANNYEPQTDSLPQPDFIDQFGASGVYTPLSSILPPDTLQPPTPIEDEPEISWESDDTAPTGILSVRGGSTTPSLNVVLTLNINPDDGSPIQQMRFSADNIIWTEWEMFQPSRAWQLENMNTVQRVYAQVQDAAGNVSAVMETTVTAVLNITPPSSANYTIACSVMGMGGGTISSGSYTVHHTIGQEYNAADLQSTNYRVLSGFESACINTTPTITPTPTNTPITPSPTPTYTATPPTPPATSTITPSPSPLPATGTPPPTATPTNLPPKYRLFLPVVLKS